MPSGRAVGKAPQIWRTKKGRFIASMKKVWLILFLSVLVWGRSSAAAEGPAAGRILYLNSYAVSSRWNDDVLAGFRAYCRTGAQPVYLDTLDLNGMDSESAGGWLRQRLTDGAYDLVVAGGNPAVELFLRETATLPRRLPLVFCGEFDPAWRDICPALTGIDCRDTRLPTLTLGRRLLPRAAAAVCLGDGAAGGNVPLPERDFQILSVKAAETRPEEIRKELGGLPPGSFIICDDSWNALPASDRREIAALAPVLATTETAFDAGAVGGVMGDGVMTGRRLAELACRILAGEAAGALPVRPAAVKTVFDWNGLRRWHLEAASLPPEAVLLHWPSPFWYRHGGWLLLLVGSIGGIAVMLLVLLWCGRRKDRKYKILLDSLPVRMGAVDVAGRVRFFQAGDAYMQCHPAELGGRLDSFVPGVQKPFQKCIRQVFRRNRKAFCEYDFEGRRRRAVFTPLPGKIFGVPTVLWVSVDVDELHRARRKMTELAERFRMTLRSIGDGVIATDERAVVTMANNVAARMTGCRHEELIGRKLSEVVQLVRIRDGGAVAPPLESALQTGRIVELPEPVDLISRDGTMRHTASSASPIRSRSGGIIGAVLVIRDVTEEYEKDDEMRRQNAVLNKTAMSADLTYFRCDGDGRVQEPVDGKWWGVRDGEPVPVEEWVCEADRPAFLAGWRRLLGGELDELELNYRSLSGGRCRYFEMRVERGRPAAGRRAGYCGTIQEVTARHETESNYYDTSVLLQNIMDNLPCYIFVKDVDDDLRYVMCNRDFARMTGCRDTDIVGKTDADFFRRMEDAERFRNDDRQVVKGGRKIRYKESFLRGDGTVACAQMYKNVIVGANGHRLLIGMGIDITRQESTEQELRNSNALLQGLMDHLPAAAVAKEAGNGFRYVLWNKMAERWSGIPSAEALGKNNFELDWLKQRAAALEEEDQLVCAGDGRNKVEAVRFPDGETRVLHTFKTLIKREQNTPLLLTLSIDVTEEKRLEQERQRLNDVLKIYADQERTVNACLENIILNPDSESAVFEVLRLVGEQTGADRCYIFENDYRQRKCRNTYEWTAAGVPALKEHLQNLALEFSPEWDRALRNRQLICSSDPAAAESPAVLPEVADRLHRRDVEALMVAGIWAEGVLWGFIGLDYVGRPHVFSETEWNLVPAAAHLIEIALARRRSQFELERKEYEKRLILDTIQIPILLFDAQMKLVWVNAMAGRLCGRRPEAIYREPCHCSFCRGSVPLERCPVHLALREGRPHTAAVRVCERDFFVSAYPIWQDGVLVNVLESCIDMTEFNESQRRLEEALEAARAADRAKSYFLATMSHELRTPLNAVIGFSELMQARHQTEAERRENLSAINFAGNTLLTLLNDVLDLSKLEAGQMDIVKAPMDLRELITETVRTFQAGCRKRDNVIATDIPERLPLLSLDQMRLRQVLFNLLGNAVKFTEHGTIRIQVAFDMDAAAAAGTLKIAVSDTGIGIAPEAQRTIFEPFRQESNRIRGNQVYQGTGLGLSISRRMVARMGGRIELESELGRGSTFTVILQDVEPAQPPAATPVANGKIPEKLAWHGRVMLVDDVPMNLRVLEAMLTQLEVPFISCVSGEEVLRQFAVEAPSAVLTDLWMPGMSGEELAARLKANPDWAKVPVVAVTADTQLNYRAGVFDGVLFKPLTLEKLGNLLHSLASGGEK